MTAKSESRSAVIALRSQVWILRIEENDGSTSVLSRGKMARIFRRSLTFGKKMLSACYMSVRRPIWINNPALPVASIGSFIETVPDFRKMTGRVSNGPTSHAVLQEVPGADLEYILTDFLKERLLRRMLLGSLEGMLPGKVLKCFTPSSSLISRFLSHSDRILASVQLGIFFHSKYIYLWPIFVKSWKQVWIRAWVLLWFRET